MKSPDLLVFRSIALMVAALCCTHCVSKNNDLSGVATETEDLSAFVPVMCDGGTIDCRSSTTAGRCAEIATSVCDTATNECIYRLNITGVGCVCIENTARECDLDAGVSGVRLCERAGPLGTRWGACQALVP